MDVWIASRRGPIHVGGQVGLPVGGFTHGVTGVLPAGVLGGGAPCALEYVTPPSLTHIDWPFFTLCFFPSGVVNSTSPSPPPSTLTRTSHLLLRCFFSSSLTTSKVTTEPAPRPTACAKAPFAEPRAWA